MQTMEFLTTISGLTQLQAPPQQRPARCWSRRSLYLAWLRRLAQASPTLAQTQTWRMPLRPPLQRRLWLLLHGVQLPQRVLRESCDEAV